MKRAFFLLVISLILFESCDLFEEDDMIFEIKVETKIVAAFTDIDMYVFSGSKTFKLEDIKELKGLKEIKITNVTISPSSPSAPNEGDFYVDQVKVESSGALAETLVLGSEWRYSTEDLLVLMQAFLDNLIKNKTAPITISGISDLGPVDEKIIFTFEIDTSKDMITD